MKHEKLVMVKLHDAKIYLKALRVIRSCNTHKQLEAAGKFCELATSAFKIRGPQYSRKLGFRYACKRVQLGIDISH